MKQNHHHRKRTSTPPQPKEPRRAIPPNPDELNTDRARWAAAALAEFQAQTGADTGDALSDLLADLLHWCDRCGQDFRQELRRALDHYEEETGESLPLTALLSEES